MNATPSPTIPELPKAADMLERVRAEAAELRSFTITFLSLLLYVAIIISSTTHEQILRIDPVKLPLLGVDIPIVGFYWFMPGFLFFLHLYILLQHYLFSQLAFRFRAALARETDEETRNNLRRSLGNLPFLHWLAGQHNGFMNFLMTAITVVSLIIWPVWTLWWLQAAFLPYHDNTIVWTQRAFLLLDATLLAYLWAKILDDEDDAGHWWQPWLAPFFYVLAKPVKAVVCGATGWLNRQLRLATWLRRLCPHRIIDWLQVWLGNGADAPTAEPNPVTLAAILDRWLLSTFLLIALFFSFFVSTIPDSSEEQWLIKRLPISWIGNHKVTTSNGKENNPPIFTLTSLLHEQRLKLMTDDQLNDYDPNRIRECHENKGSCKEPEKHASTANDMPEAEQKWYWIDSPFPRNLILREKLLVANKGLAAEVQAGLSAAAVTIKADDLAKAQGLSLQGRHLEYADFSQSSLPNADLLRARLKAANLSLARLEKVQLKHAQLPGADLAEVPLPGADLAGAQLVGADLAGAQLAGADLVGAQLAGADLFGAELTGADLTAAQLPCANLITASLLAANLTKAQLTGVYLSYSKLPGAHWTEAQFADVNMFWGRQADDLDMVGVVLSGTILTNINVALMNKEEANAQADKLNSALKNLPQYLADSGPAALVERMALFRQKITRSVVSTNLKDSRDCLADESALKVLTFCKKIGDPEARKNAYEMWVLLACHDNTEKYWIAQRMIERAKDDRFHDFAPLLAARLQPPDECPGLAGLDDTLKKDLLDAAKKTP